MSGPYGPNDPNGQWAPGPGNPDPNGGNGAPQFGQSGQPPAQGQPQFGQPPQWAGQPPQWAGQPQQPQPQQAQPQQAQPQWAQQPGQNPDQQWGEQQWGQQPGQPQWGQQPGQAPAKKSKAPLFIGLGVFVLLVVVAGAVVAGLALRPPNTLDQAAAQAGVEKIVTQSYGAEQVEGVSCPAGQEVQEGGSFECDLTVDGTMKKVTVTFTDDEGTYEVSRPT